MKEQLIAKGSVTLNRRQVAKRANVCVRTVATWKKLGLLPYVQFGPRCIRFLQSDVDQLIQKHRIGGRS